MLTEELDQIEIPIVSVDPNAGETESEWPARLQQARVTCSKGIRTIRARIEKKQRERAAAALQRMVDKRPKVAHTVIMGNESKVTIRAAQHPEKGMVTGTDDILDAFAQNSRKITTSACGKTGEYQCDGAPRFPRYKGHPEEAVDAFELRNLREDPQFPSQLASNLNIETYDQAVKQLKNGKAPGPEGIPNELLKHLPEDIHNCIYHMFTLMWKTGCTPTSWKTSNTVLLDKKEDPTECENYRPIGLAKTLYKLWTSVVTYILTLGNMRKDTTYSAATKKDYADTKVL